MANDPQWSELFITVAEWAIAQGCGVISDLPGLWTGETSEWKVALNGHDHEIEDVPPYGYLLKHKTAIAGIAMGNPFGGAVMGPSEADLIAHFRAEIPASAGGGA